MENKTATKKNVLVTLADSNFIAQAKQLFASVYFNSGWTGDYLLLAQGISAADLAWFQEKGIIIFECALLSTQPIGVKEYPAIVLSKFYLFTEYFKQWERVVFLDADIIVRFSLDELLVASGFSAPAATIRLSGEFAADNYPLFRELKRHYRLTGPAFNTGVFSFTTDLITSETFSRLMALFNKFGPLNVHGEEPTLNLFFYQNWHTLPVIYNSIPSHLAKFYRLDSRRLLAAALHFVNSVKPWKPESDYYQEWIANLERAEKIDLASRPPAQALPSKKLRTYLRYIRLVDFFLAVYRAVLFVDWQIGQAGLYLKYKNPELYKLISLRKHVIRKY